MILVEKAPAFQEDEMLQALEPIDRLAVFEHHIKTLEARASQNKRSDKAQRIRTERLNRDAYKALLHELRQDGRIHVFTKWKELYPLIAGDERYHRLLGQPGSTPLDLFRDLIVRIEDETYPHRKHIQSIMDRKSFTFTLATTFEEFVMAVHDDDHFRATVNPINVKSIYLIFMDKLTTKAKEEAKRAEKKKRKVMGELKKLYRKAHSPSIKVDTQYSEELLKQFEGRSAFEAADEDMRREVFDYVQQRLKEKQKDRSTSGRRRRDESEEEGEDMEDDRQHKRARQSLDEDDEKEEGEASSSDEDY
jgi:pre-mRNA-processing factor 40